MNENSAIAAIEVLEARFLFSGGAADLSYTTSHLSVPKWQTAAVSIGDFAFFGGGYTPNGYTDVVDIYQASTNSWKTAKLSQPRAGNVAARAGTKLIFASGISPLSNTMDVFDTKNAKWSTVEFRHGEEWSTAVSTGDVAVFVAVNGTTEVYDSRTNKWHGSKLSNVEISVGTAVGREAIFASNVGLTPILYRYNVTTGRWTTIPFPNVGGPASATTIGTQAIFAGAANTTTGLAGTIYDSVTGLLSVTPLPENSSVNSASSVGTKAIFIGDNNNVVSVYDAKINEWSTTTVGSANFRPVGTTVANKALFAGGSVSTTQAILPTDIVDIFTDTSPSPVLSGGLTGNIGHRNQVTIINTGDADLAGPYGIRLYASLDRTLNGAILVGTRGATTPLPAGASATFGVRTILPKDTPAGTYHLLAAISDGTGQLTPIAAEDVTFRVAARHTAAPANARQLKNRPGAFTRAAHSAQQWT